MEAAATKEGGEESWRPRDFFFYLFSYRLGKKGLHQQDRTGAEGVGVEEGPKNGTQNTTEGKQRRAKMEAGGDGGACFTLIL